MKKLKKVFSAALTLALVVALVLPVSAATFVSSIEQKPAPTGASGYSPFATAADGTVKDLIENIIITALSGDSFSYYTGETFDFDEDTQAEIAERLEALKAAYEAIASAASCAEIFGDSSLPDDAVCIELFDVTFIEDDLETMEEVIGGGGTVTLYFDTSIASDVNVWAYTLCDTEWVGQTAVDKGDGVIEVTFTEFCPVALVVESSSTNATVTSPQTSDSTLPVAGMIAGCFVVFAGVCFAAGRRKHV